MASHLSINLPVNGCLSLPIFMFFITWSDQWSMAVNLIIIFTNIKIRMQCKTVPEELINVITSYSIFNLNAVLLICTDGLCIIFLIGDKRDITFKLNITHYSVVLKYKIISEYLTRYIWKDNEIRKLDQKILHIYFISKYCVYN
jgi:hypothetical protein